MITNESVYEAILLNESSVTTFPFLRTIISVFVVVCIISALLIYLGIKKNRLKERMEVNKNA